MTLPKTWIDRTGTKIEICEMDDAYLLNVKTKLEYNIANQMVPFPIVVYANMFNKGKKWSVLTARKWDKQRLAAIKKEMMARLNTKGVTTACAH